MISADSTNLQGMIAAINSVVCNTKRNVFFHLITVPELTAHLRTWILKTKLASISYNIESFPSSGKHDGSNSSDCVNTSCTRFKLPLLLPKSGHDRVVHLSSDCIVQGDLSELEQVPLKPGTFAAFSDDCTSVSKQHFLPEQNKYIGHLKLVHPTLRGLRLRPSTCSFDTAVFVASANSWLRYNITSQLEFWHQVAQREDLHAGNAMEDDAAKISMLLTFHRRITVLPPLWNVRHIGVSAGSRYSLKFLKKAKLLQWDGPFKPWGRRSSHTELWEKYFVPDPLGKFRLVRKYGLQVQSDKL